MCYPVSASIVLLAVVCKEPAHIEAHGDLLLLAWFVEFLERMVRDEGCDLQRMRDGISAFEKVATHAVRVALGASAMPLNLALPPLSLASDQTSKVSTYPETSSSANTFPAHFSDLGNRDTADMLIVSPYVSCPKLYGQHAESRY